MIFMEISTTYAFLILLAILLVVASMFYFVQRTLKIEKSDHDTDLHESTGKVIKIKHDHRSGQIEIMGEFWNFISEENLSLGDSVKVISRQGLTLKVQKGEAAWNSSLS